MNPPLFKRRFVFKTAIPAFLIFFSLYFATNPKTINALNKQTFVLDYAPSIITDDEIDGFLFRVNDEIKNKVMMLDGKPVQDLPIPILFGVSIGDFTDTWGEARAGGKIHAGTDITVPRGELIVSPTKAVVTKIGYDSYGGNFVITANPGGEQFYFAHLESAAENLSAGDILMPGDLIGYAGNTGNARGKAPHLHLGIYYKGIAQNPFPRLIREFSIEERTAAINRILSSNKIIPGESNDGVRLLQRFLINNNSGLHALELAKVGSTGYFGTLTKNALSEYQKEKGIKPASGYFSSVTRASIQDLSKNYFSPNKNIQALKF